MKHPIWGFLNLVVILGFVLLFSWLNASDFDRTELIMIIEFAVAITGWEGIKKFMKKGNGNDVEN